MRPSVRDLLLLPSGEIVKDDYRRGFLVEGVAQAFRVGGGHVSAVTGNSPIFDPVGIAGEASYFFVFHRDLVEADRGGVVHVFDHFGVVLLSFLLLFVERGVFFGVVDQRVFVEPFNLSRGAREFGQG